MIKAEVKDGEVMTQGAGEPATLLVEFTAIIEQLYKNDVLNDDMLNVCKMMATSDNIGKRQFMKDELKKIIKSANSSGELEDLVEEFVDEIIK